MTPCSLVLMFDACSAWSNDRLIMGASVEQVGTQQSALDQGGGEEFGDYVLERLIGTGAMGEVWEATDRGACQVSCVS